MMLLPELTPGTERSILACLAWKQAMETAHVEPVQLLLGLLHEEEGRPHELLQRQGITRNQILSHLQIEAAVIEPSSELPSVLEPVLEKWLYDARLLAIEQSGLPLVHSEHLLVTLLDSEDTLKTVLTLLGYDHKRLSADLGIDAKPALTLEEPLRLTESTETVSLARIIDANANRAREALRVLEELARFHLNDAYLTRLSKEIRHDLTQTLADHLPRHRLLRSRDTDGDVGTRLRTAGEDHRQSLKAVLRANAQRLQEALRSLEEYGKVISAQLGRVIEKLRYQSYTLERALFIGDRSSELLAHAHLYLLVSKGGCAASLEWTIEQAARGGVSIVQLREKNKCDRELLAVAKEVRAITRKLGILFIMNDRPDLAKLSQADGVHLGQDDLDPASARSVAGSDLLIGVSTHNVSQLEKAILDGADYVGVGPTFASKTKQFNKLAGIEFLRKVAGYTQLPSFALGGIGPNNVSDVIAAGIRRVAVGEAICQSDEPEQTAKSMMQKLKLNN